MQFTSTFGRWVYVLRVEGLAQFSWSFFSTSLSGFAVLGFSVVKTLESELGTLIKGVVLLLYIIFFYSQNSEFCFFQNFFFDCRESFAVNTLRPWPSFNASFLVSWSNVICDSVWVVPVVKHEVCESTSYSLLHPEGVPHTSPGSGPVFNRTITRTFSCRLLMQNLQISNPAKHLWSF